MSSARPVRSPSPGLVVTAAMVVTLAGCGQTPTGTRSATAGLPDLEQSLTASEWVLDPADSSLAEAGTGLVTLAFADATAVSGSAPCNTYRGPVELEGDAGLRFGALATTRMECEPVVMAAEQEYLAALEIVRTADTADPDRLVLTGEGVRLSFTAGEAG